MYEATQVPAAVESPVETKAEAPTAEASKASAASPAQDLRDIQMLLLGGQFPGNVAPQVIKSYHLLEQMASEVEKAANVSK